MLELPAKVKRLKAARQVSQLEESFANLWAKDGWMRQGNYRVFLPYVREYHFALDRKWRLDFAWPAQKVAVEIEGGVYTKGRHTRASGFIADCDKYNALAAAGWRLFRFTEKHLAKRPVQCCELVAAALVSPRGAGEASS